MTRFGLILLFALLVLIGGAVATYLVLTSKQAVQAPVDTASTTPIAVGDAIYTNGTFGFVIQYPESATVDNNFTSYYHLPPYWRANALPNATGTPVVSFTAYSTKSENSFPRYFAAIIRVGVSTDKLEIAQCLKVIPNQGETALPDVTLNGTVWKAFSFESAGMQQYVRGVSYRSVHEGRCIALEKIAVGSSYTDDPVSEKDIPQSTLDAKYAELDRIVQSFTFVRP